MIGRTIALERQAQGAQREAFVAMAWELWQLTAELRRLLGGGVDRETAAQDSPAPAG